MKFTFTFRDFPSMNCRLIRKVSTIGAANDGGKKKKDYQNFTAKMKNILLPLLSR